MRIFRTSQSSEAVPQASPATPVPSPATPQPNGRIPDVIDGNQVPIQVKTVMQPIDNKYHLTAGEIEWVLNGLDEDYAFLSNPQASIRWDKVESQIGRVFEWGRETHKK